MDVIMTLIEKSCTPLYQQLMEDVKSSINQGKYRPGEKIPTEPELSEQYNVSRITVRRAIEELCIEGYLIKKQGKGTFVDTPKIQRKIEKADDALSFSDICAANGMEYSSHVISTKKVIARPDELKFFRMSQGSYLLYIQRVLCANGEPIQLENNFFPLPKFEYLVNEDFLNKSMFKTLRTKHGIDICQSVNATLEIVRSNEENAKLLNVPVGEPLFYMNAYLLDSEGNPTVVGRQYIVGKRYVFHI